MKKYACYLLLLLPLQPLLAQQQGSADSALLLDKITVTAFQQNREVSFGTIVPVLNHTRADLNNKTSFVTAFNTVAGVRMEERSPGSYRINMRGSSLRSPFGVRNIKTYWNDIPVTDAGGNTYFNQFAFNNFSAAEIIKGPAGSMYGAGTGGVLLLHSFETLWKPSVSAEYTAGSYGLQQVLLSAGLGSDDARSLVTYAHTEAGGYRDNTAIKRDNVSFNTRLTISGRQQLTGSVLYSNLYYQTPGGLNKAEFTANPKQARPAAGGLPGAAAARAAIFQKNFLAGISHQYQFTAAFKNTTSLYGAIVNIQNPTFRNYERRVEPGFGGRTTFVYDTKISNTQLQLVAGGELQEGYFNTQVSKNKNGNPDTLQTNDDIRYTVYSVFAQADVTVAGNWIITAGASINKSKVVFTRLNSYPVLKQGRNYQNEISPRIALQKKMSNNATVFGSISKGFSPPVISELLPSTGVISTFLEAEEGVNYELGGKWGLFKNRLHLEATAFYFKLQNALVSRKDSSNADYYVNAGNTRQKGLEISSSYAAAFNKGIARSLIVHTAYAYNDFRYGSFQKGTAVFSGNYLPGVPQHTLAVSASLQFLKGVYFKSTWYYSSKIFLEDANAVPESGYHLLGARAGWKLHVKKAGELHFYAGADNLLNEVYSLGNDLNAAAGRYYNAAPLRNYYAGIAVQWNHIKKQQQAVVSLR